MGDSFSTAESRREWGEELRKQLLTSDDFVGWVEGRYDDETLLHLAEIAEDNEEYGIRDLADLTGFRYGWQAKIVYDAMSQDVWDEMGGAAEDFGYGGALSYLLRNGEGDSPAKSDGDFAHMFVMMAIASAASLLVGENIDDENP